MSACILSGFAKKNKYVGTVYACDGSDLPATQDFGTVQFSGPFESAQTVPATTVTYTIIGKTPCGDDIRRITTKTYASRNTTNNFKVTGIFDGNPNGAVPTWTATLIGYGATLQDALNSCCETAKLLCPQSCILTGYSNYHGVVPITYTTVTGGQNYLRLQHYITELGGNNLNTYATSQPATTTTGVTLYYLDVHEVWTYDLV